MQQSVFKVYIKLSAQLSVRETNLDSSRSLSSDFFCKDPWVHFQNSFLVSLTTSYLCLPLPSDCPSTLMQPAWRASTMFAAFFFLFCHILKASTAFPNRFLYAVHKAADIAWKLLNSILLINGAVSVGTDTGLICCIINWLNYMIKVE